MSNQPPPDGLVPRRDILRWGAASLALLGASACTSAVEREARNRTSTPGTRGGRLVIAQGTDIIPKTVVNQSAQNATWRRQVFNSLIRLDRKTHEVLPELATAWKTSDGGRVTTLTLREGVTWHSGRPFTVDDVRFSVEFQRDMQPPFAFAWLLERLSGVEAVDSGTVRLAFEEPVNNLFDALSLMIMLDRESAQELTTGARVIGTGPFTFAEYRQGTSLRLDRYAKYWESGRPALDSVLVRVITKPEARMSALRSGQVHLATGVGPMELKQVESDRTFTVTPYDTYSSGVYLGCNVNAGPLKDKRVRQAVHYALDRRRIAEEIYRGKATPNATPWSATSPAHNQRLADHYARDLTRAVSLLKEAGADGAELILESAQPVGKSAEIVEFNLREAGLKPRLRVLNATQQQERIESRSFEGMWMGQHGYNNLSPTNLLYSAMPYRTTQNLFNFASERYEKLAQAALRATGESEQRAAYDAVTEFILDEAFCCDLVHATSTAVTHGVSDWDYTVWDDVLLGKSTVA
ncbi:peptide/nickel transport system substrate-binding protein [Nonomuraea polychroma]|uniref:Peptide/nickel transport system substrate-binding protein n=1 Tax=Nonomuraea polychroma TaxID=46176 RepID=A0A438M8A7_9ACTN|nr:ABC transporter substrate-binding protein [Nonomuraea polychroma]RVX41942.1 peptide/nickel transport system substrate-binding protein [Nonomuraea polychroma]